MSTTLSGLLSLSTYLRGIHYLYYGLVFLCGAGVYCEVKSMEVSFLTKRGAVNAPLTGMDKDYLFVDINPLLE